MVPRPDRIVAANGLSVPRREVSLAADDKRSGETRTCIREPEAVTVPKCVPHESWLALDRLLPRGKDPARRLRRYLLDTAQSEDLPTENVLLLFEMLG